MLQSCVSYASGELHLARSIDSCWIREARLIQYALNAPESVSAETIPFFTPPTSC